MHLTRDRRSVNHGLTLAASRHGYDTGIGHNNSFALFPMWSAAFSWIDLRDCLAPPHAALRSCAPGDRWLGLKPTAVGRSDRGFGSCGERQWDLKSSSFDGMHVYIITDWQGG